MLMLIYFSYFFMPIFLNFLSQIKLSPQIQNYLFPALFGLICSEPHCEGNKTLSGAGTDRQSISSCPQVRQAISQTTRLKRSRNGLPNDVNTWRMAAQAKQPGPLPSPRWLSLLPPLPCCLSSPSSLQPGNTPTFSQEWALTSGLCPEDRVFELKCWQRERAAPPVIRITSKSKHRQERWFIPGREREHVCEADYYFSEAHKARNKTWFYETPFSFWCSGTKPEQQDVNHFSECMLGTHL